MDSWRGSIQENAYSQSFDSNSVANGDMNSTKVSKMIYESSSFQQKKNENFLTNGHREIGSDIWTVFVKNRTVQCYPPLGGLDPDLGGRTHFTTYP